MAHLNVFPPAVVAAFPSRWEMLPAVAVKPHEPTPSFNTEGATTTTTTTGVPFDGGDRYHSKTHLGGPSAASSLSLPSGVGTSSSKPSRNSGGAGGSAGAHARPYYAKCSPVVNTGIGIILTDLVDVYFVFCSNDSLNSLLRQRLPGIDIAPADALSVVVKCLHGSEGSSCLVVKTLPARAQLPSDANAAPGSVVSSSFANPTAGLPFGAGAQNQNTTMPPPTNATSSGVSTTSDLYKVPAPLMLELTTALTLTVPGAQPIQLKLNIECLHISAFVHEPLRPMASSSFIRDEVILPMARHLGAACAVGDALLGELQRLAPEAGPAIGQVVQRAAQGVHSATEATMPSQQQSLAVPLPCATVRIGADGKVTSTHGGLGSGPGSPGSPSSSVAPLVGAVPVSFLGAVASVSVPPLPPPPVSKTAASSGAHRGDGATSTTGADGSGAGGGNGKNRGRYDDDVLSPGRDGLGPSRLSTDSGLDAQGRRVSYVETPEEAARAKRLREEMNGGGLSLGPLGSPAKKKPGLGESHVGGYQAPHGPGDGASSGQYHHNQTAASAARSLTPPPPPHLSPPPPAVGAGGPMLTPPPAGGVGQAPPMSQGGALPGAPSAVSQQKIKKLQKAFR